MLFTAASSRLLYPDMTPFQLLQLCCSQAIEQDSQKDNASIDQRLEIDIHVRKNQPGCDHLHQNCAEHGTGKDGATSTKQAGPAKHGDSNRVKLLILAEAGVYRKPE